MKNKYIYSILILIAGLSNIHAHAQSLNPFTAGTIRPGDSIVIYYDVTINNPCNCTQVSNQGSVSGSNFVTLNTDDPDTGPVGDATVTSLNLFPLPVSLIDLNASLQSNGVEVSWNVGSETGMQQYEVERSNDGRSYTRIGIVAALNGPGMRRYSFTDGQPGAGNNFYRLKMVETTGSWKYSTVVRIDLAGRSSNVGIYPNPVLHQLVTLQFSNMARGSYQLVLYNNLGQAVFTKNIVHDGGSATKNIYLPSSIISGIYMTVLKNEQVVLRQTLMVQ